MAVESRRTQNVRLALQLVDATMRAEELEQALARAQDKLGNADCEIARLRAELAGAHDELTRIAQDVAETTDTDRPPRGATGEWLGSRVLDEAATLLRRT